jgi:hypothetical protein
MPHQTDPGQDDQHAEKNRMLIGHVLDCLPALTGVGNAWPDPDRAIRLTECRLIELHLAVTSEIVSDLLPGSGGRV